MSRIPFALLALLLVPVAFAEDRLPPLPADATVLEIDAHGEVQRTPDVATISAGVVTRDADANAAMNENARRMTAVIAALKQAGVNGRDIQTSGIGLQPQYSYDPKKPPTITGYEASNSVNVRLRDMAKIGQVLGVLVKQGANQISGPNFSVDKPAAALDDARRAAIEQARSRAELYAQASGLKVRRILSISESGSTSAPPRPMMRNFAVAAAPMAEAPVEAGQNTLAVDLDVKFELGQN